MRSKLLKKGWISMMRKSVLVLIAVLTLATVGLAQAPKVVSGNMVLETDGAHAGSTVKAAVVAEVASGYHINDHVPSLDYLIPTELKLQPLGPLTVATTKYPKGSPQKFSFLDTPISVYQGKLIVGAEIKVASGTQPGDYTLKGSLDYQACNDRACLPPTSLPLTLSVKVVPRSETLKPVNTDVFHGLKFN
jgi:thioredoxin:protein disulfide reductase